MATYIGEMQKLVIGDKEYSLPSGGTDTKVTQTATTTSANYEILFSETADNTTRTEGARKTSTLTFNPATSTLNCRRINSVAYQGEDNSASITNDGSTIQLKATEDNTGRVYVGNQAIYIGFGSSTYTNFFSATQDQNTMAIAVELTNLVTPTNDTDAATKGYVDSAISGITITDEKMKWTASTSSNTYYPLQSTSTATTSTANTLNSISFYQYYNTAGGYRRLQMGNTTAYTSTGGAYGTIRLYGPAATYYGDLNPGTIGTASGDGHLTANRTWTLPNATGTIALTSDIPSAVTETTVSSWGFTKNTGTVTSVGLSSSRGLDISGSPITGSGSITINNTGVLTVEASPSAAGNGTIAVTTGTANGSSTAYVAVKGLAAAAYKGVTDNSSATAVTSSDTNLITARTLYYAGYTKNSGTVTSVGLTNATNGGLTISGSPVTGSGSITVGHSNVLTSAQTTQAVYPIKIDKNGHISAYGTAVTIPSAVTETTVSGWGFTKNAGTVTSVGVSNATNGGLSVSGSPVTSSGTITIGLASAYGDTKNPYGSKTANYVLAAPNGSAGVPSFRALVAADIPDLSGTYVPVTQTGDAYGNSLLPSTTTITIDPNNTGSVIQCTSTQDTELSQLNMGPWGASLQAGIPGEMGLNAIGNISVGTSYNLVELDGYGTNGSDSIICQGGEIDLQSFNTDYTSGTQTIITPSAFNIIHATDSSNSSLFNIDTASGAFSVPLYVNNNLVCNDMDISYNGNTYAPIMVYFPTGVSQTLAAGHVLHTTTFTMPAPYIHVIGVRAIDTNHQSVLQLTTFNINGDGASGNTVSCVAHYYNRGSSSVATTVTWELVLSTW